MTTPGSHTLQGPDPALLGQVWPTREDFHRLAAGHRCVPVAFRVLADEITPISLYRKLTAGAGAVGSFLLESVTTGELGRYSIVGVQARATLTEREGSAHWSGDVPAGVPTGGDTFAALRDTARAFQARKFPQLPPFTGGLVGFLSGEVRERWQGDEATPTDTVDEPELCMLLAQDVAVYDHRDSTVLLVANALNLNGLDTGADAAYDRALERLTAMRSALRTPVDANPATYGMQRGESKRADGESATVSVAVTPTESDPLDIYRVLRRLNPAPYQFLVRGHNAQGAALDVVGSSPSAVLTSRGSADAVGHLPHAAGRTHNLHATTPAPGVLGAVVGYIDFAGDLDFAAARDTAVLFNGEARTCTRVAHEAVISAAAMEPQ